ncbi:MAG TPA: Glu-tRNA(Gln) amidotransferase subunit GatE [Candidatus Nanoarchaeia archaeon]|nr:Glu-tRNA(Gln) amidotransferase subunit GatE [Candidatus Nanoarchaeia archaeon]
MNDGEKESKDYASLGFRCGLEIHQQLEGRKLFCSCPAVITDREPDFTVRRRLRAVAGETGEVDIAAAHEVQKAKEFVYQCYHDATCLVELDEEPPHPISQEALQAALEVAQLLRMKVVDRVQVMRKTVVDGSNTSAFQRTALVARDGSIETAKGKVRIATLCLEEEAAKVVRREKGSDIYNLSRLGIPLLEIATAADIQDPEHAKEVAYRIGLLLRSTGRMRRGLGTIRQDVNVSVRGGVRTEIKGFQDYRNIPKVIDHEIGRQLQAIRKGELLQPEVRKAEPDNTTSFLRPMPGPARLYPETDVPLIIPVSSGRKVEHLDERMERLRATGLQESVIDAVVRKNMDIESLMRKYPNVPPAFIAETLITTPKEIRRRYGKEIDILQHADELLRKVNAGELTREAVFEILVEIAQGKEVDYARYQGADLRAIEQEIAEMVKSKKGLSPGAYMGMVMQKYRGKIEGKKVAKLVEKLLKKG